MTNHHEPDKEACLTLYQTKGEHTGTTDSIHGKLFYTTVLPALYRRPVVWGLPESWSGQRCAPAEGLRQPGVVHLSHEHCEHVSSGNDISVPPQAAAHVGTELQHNRRSADRHAKIEAAQ